MGNTLYFVVDDISREQYIKQGSKQFSYMTKKGECLVRRYYEVPADLREDQQELLDWARQSIRAAKVTVNKKKPKKLNIILNNLIILYPCLNL